MYEERPPLPFQFTVYYECPVSFEHRVSAQDGIALEEGAVLRGRVKIFATYYVSTGPRFLQKADIPTRDSLGLMFGDRPPRPANDCGASKNLSTVHAFLFWDVDTREYADGPHTLILGNATWMRHYPDAVASTLAGGKTISLSIVVANGESSPE